MKKFASEFIDRRIRLEYDSVDIQAVTDEKWFAFVVEQLLSNALKYTREGSIKIYSEGKVLCIKDTGIGIAPEDLRACLIKAIPDATAEPTAVRAGSGFISAAAYVKTSVLISRFLQQ